MFKKDEAEDAGPGQRIPVLTSESDIEVDPATAAIPITLPESGGERRLGAVGRQCSKSMGQLALGNASHARLPSRAARQHLKSRLAASPVVAGGRVYTIDTLGTVRAFDAQTAASTGPARL